METFSALLAICAGNSPVPGEFSAQRPVTPSFDIFFDLRLNKRLSKQSRGWWFETLSHPLWRHCNAFQIIVCAMPTILFNGASTSACWHVNASFSGPVCITTGTKWLPLYSDGISKSILLIESLTFLFKFHISLVDWRRARLRPR